MRSVGLILLVLAIGLGGVVPSAQARHWHVGVNYYARPYCVTDYYGWNAPVGGFGSGFGVSSGGYYRSSFSSVGYGPWGWGPTVYPAYPSPFYSGVVYPGVIYPNVVVQQTTTMPIDLTIVNTPRDPNVARPRVVVVNPALPRAPNMLDIVHQHAERRDNMPLPPDDETVVRAVSGSSRAGRERSKQFQAEGDRWLREGQNVKAYLKYLEAQREAEDRGEVYFRQAFVLVAMGRYSHAVSKLKRGLQVDPKAALTGQSLDQVYGVENVDHKVEYLQRVADWANAEVRDPDRLFLMGVLLHFDDDARSGEFINAAWKIAGKGQHIQAFLQPAGSLPQRIPVAQAPVIAKGRPLDLPPTPADDPTLDAEPRKLLPNPPPQARKALPLPAQDNRGPRLPTLEVPPEPARRQLILPDVYLPEENR